MSRSDYVGLGTSLLLHVLLGILFAMMTRAPAEAPKIGYVEVEFGEFSAGQPVKAVDEAPQSTTPDPPEEEPEPQPQPETDPEPPVQTEPEPVETPEEEPPSDETIPPTDEEADEEETTPDPAPQPEESTPEPEPEQQQGADEQEPSDEPGDAEDSDPGEGNDEQKSAPYDIEGLDRDPVRAPLPSYDANVNARISVRITVDPQGRIVRRIPLMKGDPQLEESVLNALQRWRFNPLPSGAPQENQTGTITFTFQLE